MVKIKVDTTPHFYQSQFLNHFQKKFVKLFCCIEFVCSLRLLAFAIFILYSQFFQSTPHCVSAGNTGIWAFGKLR